MSTNVDNVQSRDVPFLDLGDPDFDFHSPEVAEAQARNWYAETPLGPLVLRYAEARALLRDQRLDHNGRRFLEMNGVFDGPIYEWFVPMVLNRDGEHHHRLRGLVRTAFTPRMVDELRPSIRSAALELAEKLASAKGCEFVRDFGDQLPLVVMCELLGVPREDYDTFSVWTTDIGLVFSLTHDIEVRPRVEIALVGLHGYVDALMKDRKANPGDDLISALVGARQDSQVSWEELRNLIVTLVFGAHDTTRHQLGNAMVTFAEHPEQWQLLGSRPELASQAVEEVMRWRPATPTLYRFATTDFDFEGLDIAKDTFILACVATAQRDPLVFHDGSTFDIAAAREAPPLQFGAGPHHCLGAALARAEVGEALHALASRLGPPAITGPFTWRPPLGNQGPNTLPLRFGSRS
jgi:cytochrome P450